MKNVSKLFLVLLLAVMPVLAQFPILGPYGVLPVNLAGNVFTDTGSLTTAAFSSSILTGTPTAGATYTTPSAAALCALFPFLGANNTINWSYDWYVKNTSGGANTITMSGGSGVTITGTATVAQNNVKQFKVLFRSCASGSAAVVLISLGTSVF